MSSEYNPFDRFTDEELASIGINRGQVSSEAYRTGSFQNLLTDQIKEEALQQAQEEEEGIEQLVDQALDALESYPDNRIEALAWLQGNAYKDVADIEIDGDQAFHLFVFTVLKLAEARTEIERLGKLGMPSIADGNTRSQ